MVDMGRNESCVDCAGNSSHNYACSYNPISNMIAFLRQFLILLAAIGLVMYAWKWLPRKEKNSGKEQAARVRPPVRVLSSMAPKPDWSRLENYQGTIRKEQFEKLLSEQFSMGESWKSMVVLGDESAMIQKTSTGADGVYPLAFAKDGQEKVSKRYWRKVSEMGTAPMGQPLAGVKIAIDPGHIGGAWAQMEERYLKFGDHAAICEGDMTLTVGKMLKDRLEAFGASVTMVRRGNMPVTRLKPENLVELAKRELPVGASAEMVTKASERLFYRTAEIRARAQLVNNTIKPDVVLCLHFNADGWGDSAQPVMVEHSHFHVLVHGAYAENELVLEDQRLAMFEKLLSGSGDEEIELAKAIADHFSKATGLPAYQYGTNQAVRSVPGQPYVWVRNLLANRLYECPVIYMEPYVMNSKVDYARMVAGDFSGSREVDGRLVRSIYREYADELANSLALYYRNARKKP